MQVDWLSINPMEGNTGETEVYAYVTENDRIGRTRFAVVRFTNEEGLYADLNLTQTSNTEDMVFELSPDYIYVPGGGGVYYVNITSNTYWKVTDYDTGLRITTDNMDGYGDGILTIEFPVNPNTHNVYKYDHYGRPFYGRDGYITVTSPTGEKKIFWEQAAYEAITVTPKELIFPQTGGTLQVTVKSATDWSLTSYDTAHTSFSALSGHSGETVISVTKSGLTPTQIEYYVTYPSTAVFSDGMNTAVLSIKSTLDDYYTDDDYLTVTYYVPSANTEIQMYMLEWSATTLPTARLFQDNDWTNIRTETEQYSAIDAGRTRYYVAYTTAGYHTIKFKFGNGLIMPKYFLYGNSWVNKIVVGNRCEGTIAACSATLSGAKEVILGVGNIDLIGEYAFYGCGSTTKDFVFGSNVQDYMYQPFHKMKAKKFVFNRAQLGEGENYTYNETKESPALRTFIISGVSYNTYGSAQVNVTGTTSFSPWGTKSSGYPGDISCQQLVIGEEVVRIHNTPFYPYGFDYYKVSANTISVPYKYASATYYGKDSLPDSRITGWSMNSIACVRRTSPTVDKYDFTPVTQSFDGTASLFPNGTNPKVYTKGPQRSIPLHYPIGADYSAWSGKWSNLVGDLDL